MHSKNNGILKTYTIYFSLNLKLTFAKINNMEYNSRTLIYQNNRVREVPRGLQRECSPKMEL